jgi:21S rRNA (GM2251-2'-O)-methyltransferase
MSMAALSGAIYKLVPTSLWTSRLCRSIQQSRAVSLNSAIGRGLRRSKAVGFRGKERLRESEGGDPPYPTRRRDNVVRSAADGPTDGATIRAGSRGKGNGDTSSFRIWRGKKLVADPRASPPRRSRAARFYDPDHRFGRRSLERRAREESGTQARRSESPVRLDSSDRAVVERAPDSVRPRDGRPAHPASLSGDSRRGADNGVAAPRGRMSWRKDGRSWSGGDDAHPPWTNKQPRSDARHGDDRPAAPPAVTRAVNKRFPVSVPYTTAASEFLYGTSVIEAALRSRRSPRRKLYKLYIHAGANRENARKDAEIEQLAKRNGVDVVRADADWLRVMDKMSGGRPHNGYVLESSPLPRLPVSSLGRLSSRGERPGFSVVVDHQSSEEAAVNGTDSFIPRARHTAAAAAAKPLVLLVDGILDPGNLGGIIRSAAFLGVAAVAVASRNSAAVSPVVLKASAGAAEDIALFAVRSPLAFVADSKRAGWKIYSAVAPSASQSTAGSRLWSDELRAPLLHDPVLLMIGSEGDGLRHALRSKANVELSIHGGIAGVDSLNVAVATGILCHAILRLPQGSAGDNQGLTDLALAPSLRLF